MSITSGLLGFQDCCFSGFSSPVNYVDLNAEHFLLLIEVEHQKWTAIRSDDQ